MLALRMPDQAFFSHTTAALLLRAPLPFEHERNTRLHVSVAAPARAPHARGLVGHSLDLSRGEITVSRGIPHTSPARTWCDLGNTLGLLDLVAVGDYLIHWRTPLCSVTDLRDSAQNWEGRRGAKLLRSALPLLNDRSESRPESQLRVIVTLAGLPAPEVNYVIVSTETGRHVRTDLAFAEARVLLEYQGSYHRTAQQWRKDMTRRSRLEAEGWYVMEINSDDLKDPDELVARIRTVLRRRLA